MTIQGLLLHGFAGGPWSFADVLRSLGPRHDWLAPALTYHAETPSDPLPQADFGSEVANIAKRISSHCSRPIDLIGYSLGGRLALGVAIAHPKLVRRLVLISARRGLDSIIERQQRKLDDEVWARLLEREGMEAFLGRWFAQPLFRSLASLPPACLEVELEQRRRHRPLELVAALRHLGLGDQPSYAEEVRELQIPVTLVVGELDEKFTNLARQLATELPQSQLVVVERAGHHLLLEAPVRVAQIIGEEPER